MVSLLSGACTPRDLCSSSVMLIKAFERVVHEYQGPSDASRGCWARRSHKTSASRLLPEQHRRLLGFSTVRQVTVRYQMLPTWQPLFTAFEPQHGFAQVFRALRYTLFAKWALSGQPILRPLWFPDATDAEAMAPCDTWGRMLPALGGLPPPEHPLPAESSAPLRLAESRCEFEVLSSQSQILLAGWGTMSWCGPLRRRVNVRLSCTCRSLKSARRPHGAQNMLEGFPGLNGLPRSSNALSLKHEALILPGVGISLKETAVWSMQQTLLL